MVDDKSNEAGDEMDPLAVLKEVVLQLEQSARGNGHINEKQGFGGMNLVKKPGSLWWRAATLVGVDPKLPPKEVAPAVSEEELQEA